MQRVEWNNRCWIFPHLVWSFFPFLVAKFFIYVSCLCRAISTLHAIYIATISLYFVFWSDLYSDQFAGLIILRCSQLSTFALGVSMPKVIWFAIAITAVDVYDYYVCVFLIRVFGPNGISLSRKQGVEGEVMSSIL